MTIYSALLVVRVDVGIPVEQQLHHLPVATVRSSVQCIVIDSVVGVDLGILVEQ
jgi:hypothetical protein